jgi:hypothetical protein
MGRMGNQMFQYACAKNLELQYGFTCSMDDLSKLEYFELAPGERWKNQLKIKFFFHLAKRLNGMEVHNLAFEDMLQDYTQWLQKLQKPSMVWGFFQSEQYFKENRGSIKKYFQVKKMYQDQFYQYLKHLDLQQGKYNAVHIRRTDYKGFQVKSLLGDDFTLPLSYYTSAMENLDTTIPTLFISDDAAYCKATFSHIPNTFFSDADAIVDFQLLSNAKHAVISNSTFAWWAAWLNPIPNNTVYCPKYFLGFKENKEVPLGIYPSQWTQIEVIL